ncbi:hypothetical protein C9374_003656 [Naegleria lovaniensis]|uniref:Uncharacterized protein n=1 Tax=Naegleria lovaniensis TaxID=51637 RepID=A0AA88KS81_NAELO|nr:uncharacterized protein C9374_003656 [Naegleria lovaniensis]KAG2393892.1 hypothetical protein C9374_003656 [Naegleria lovaniensis]
MSSLLSKPWLLTFMQDNLQAILEKKAESQPSPAKHRNLVQIIDHSENLEVRRVQHNDIYVLHISDGFHFVTARISSKFVKRFYRLHPDYCPLSKLRGAIIRLDSYSFNMGGPNQTPCSLLLNRFDYIGSASSATFRSPKNTLKILSSFISSFALMRDDQTTNSNNHEQHKHHIPHCSPITTVQNNLNSIPEIVSITDENESLRLIGAKNINPNKQKTATDEQDTQQILETNKTNVNGINTSSSIIIQQFNNTKNNNSTLWSIDHFITMMMNSTNNNASREETKSQTPDNNSKQKGSEEKISNDISVSVSSEQTTARSAYTGDFFQNEEENCLISASQLEQVNNMEIQGFNNSESLMIPPNPSQTTFTSSQFSSFSSKHEGEPSLVSINNTTSKLSSTPQHAGTSSKKGNSTPSTTINSPNIQEAHSASTPKVNQPSKNTQSSPQIESPNIVSSAVTPKPNHLLSPALGMSVSTLKHFGANDASEGTIVFTSQSQSLTPMRINQYPVNTQPLPPTPADSEIKTSTSSAEASIIQSQVISDGDSSDVLDDENQAEIAFSQKASSVFSPSASRYRNMASPNVFLHTQAASQKSDDLPLTQLPQTTKLPNKRRLFRRVKTYLNDVANESSDEALDEDEGFPRSLFMKDPLLLENFAIQNVKQRTESFQSMREIIERKNKEMKSAKRVASHRPITNEEMIDYLQTEPAEERRKSQTVHNNASHTENVSKQAETTSENVIEETPSKKIKMSPLNSSQKENIAPLPSPSLPQFAKPVDHVATASNSLIVTPTTTSSASPSLPVQSTTTKEQQQNHNNSSKHSVSKKVNYRAWLDFI